MPTFNVTLAHDVSVYGSVEVDADDLAAAVEKVRAELAEGSLWDEVIDVDYSTSHDFRIVSIGHGIETLAGAIQISEEDECNPLPAEEVLASLTAQRISK